MTNHLPAIGDLEALLVGGGSVYLSGCAAEIPGFERIALNSENNPLNISGIFLPGINKCNYSTLANNARCQTYFMTPQMAVSSVDGGVNYCPWRYREIIRHYLLNPVDVAVVMLSEPDAEGFCSYGVTSDFAPFILPAAKTRVGIINSQMPYIPGEKIAFEELDVVVRVDSPLIETAAARIDDVSRQIACNIAGFIENGATLQLGLGSIPGAVASVIQDRRGLKIHSGLIEASALELDAAGALCPDTPILGGVALGTKDFYDALHNNNRVSFRSVLTTHDVDYIASADSFVAVNGALQVDLLGQVNSSVLPKGYISGPGGLPEFVAGSLASENGRSIIALNATAKSGEISRIVPVLQCCQPSVSALDVDVVVTEFGVAELRGKGLSERIARMIAIADPAHRDALAEAARTAF